MGFWSRLGEDVASAGKNTFARTRQRANSLISSTAAVPFNAWHSIVNSAMGIKTLVLGSPEGIKAGALAFYSRTLSMPERTLKWFVNLRNLTLKDFARILINNAILLCLVAILLGIIGTKPDFLSGLNIVAILSQSSTKLIIALGTGIIIVARGTDLSAGRVVGLSSLIGSLFCQKAIGDVQKGMDPTVVVIISMLVGVAIGFCNGYLVSVFKIDPFIATLSLMLIVYGLNQYFVFSFSGGQAIAYDQEYREVVTRSFKWGTVDFPYVIFISFGVAFIMWIIWNRTGFGRKVFAVGGNPKAAAVSGISVGLILLCTYMLGGAMYGLGGLLNSWQASAVNSESGSLYELDAIAACIVGGLSFTGGKGRISGIILGVLIFQAIQYGFTYIGQQSSIISIIKGAIIAAAVAFDMVKNRQRV